MSHPRGVTKQGKTPNHANHFGVTQPQYGAKMFTRPAGQDRKQNIQIDCLPHPETMIF